MCSSLLHPSPFTASLFRTFKSPKAAVTMPGFRFCTSVTLTIATIILLVNVACSSSPPLPPPSTHNSANVAYQRSKAQRKSKISSDVTDELVQVIEKEVETSGNSQLLALLRRSMPLCGKLEDNFVLSSGRNKPRHLNFSVAEEALRYVEEMRKHKYTSKHTYDHKCTNTADFLTSIARGERVCAMHLIPPRDICQILDQYSLVFWLGNSLTRHTMNALLMLLTEDLQEGAIPSGKDNMFFPYYICHCDGQFSEAKECRLYNYKSSQLPNAIMEQCKKHLPSATFLFFDGIPLLDNMNGNGSQVQATDLRPISVITTGRQDILDYAEATPFEQRDTAQQSLQKLIDLRLQKIRQATGSSSSDRKTLGIVIGEGVQDRSKDKLFPYQRRESILKLNHHTQKILSTNVLYQNFTFLDFYNLTLTPPAATSDGVHYLAATNIGKANSVLHLMSLLVKGRGNNGS